MIISRVQNKVSLGAVKVTPDPNINTMDPIKRNCLFHNEHPPNHPLQAHQNYSQVWTSFSAWILFLDKNTELMK